jgi:methyl-accepting chemotaxis protein
VQRKVTFNQRLSLGFATLAVLGVAVSVVSVYALRDVVAAKDRVIDGSGVRLVDAERLHSLNAKKAADSRAYLLTQHPEFLESTRNDRAQLRATIAKLRSEVETNDGRALLDEIERTEDTHERALEDLMALRSTGMPVQTIATRYDQTVKPLREQLDQLVDRFVERETRLMADGRAASTAIADRAVRLVLTLGGLTIGAAIAASLLLARALSRQISTAVRHVQSSSAELKATAGQQATGAKQQASAMNEIATTLNELLATSRQISDSARQVAAIANETAAAARAGDETVIRSQESAGNIRRQVDLIVGHMLELGPKSQQIGGILDIINELAEQTNILAINATIEAAGAGEGGKRFAVVAEEIRKLADRVGGSTKDIRALIDEVRSAVNTTVMASEGGAKAVEAGARQFSDVAAAFAQIAQRVETTTEATREIELSTKQQASAVEQLNVAISNVAQATREAEASSGQTFQTAAQLATMSRDLARLVQASVAA